MDARKSIPFEIITTILLLLPPKVLAKFMCVCKSWKELITDPIFAKQYLKNSTKNGDGFIMHMSMHDDDDETYLSFNLLDDKSFQEDSRLRIPPSSEWSWNLMVGSFNGIVCLSDMVNNFGFNIYFCNPSIWKYRIVRSSSINMRLAAHIVLGFGYDSQTHDLKVVRIAHGEFIDFVHTDIDSYNTRVEVYSFNTNSWKQMDERIFFPWGLAKSYSEVVINESIHWVAMDIRGIDGAGNKLLILAFDLREEVFKEIQMPPEYAMEKESYNLSEFIGVFKEAISLFTYSPGKHGPGSWRETCDLWVMKEYGNVDSWSKQYTIKVEGRVDLHRPLKFTNHGEIILFDDEQNVFVYNFRTHRTIYLGILASSYFGLVTFTKSLAMIDEINEPLERLKSFPPPPTYRPRSIKML